MYYRPFKSIVLHANHMYSVKGSNQASGYVIGIIWGSCFNHLPSHCCVCTFRSIICPYNCLSYKQCQSTNSLTNCKQPRMCLLQAALVTNYNEDTIMEQWHSCRGGRGGIAFPPAPFWQWKKYTFAYVVSNMKHFFWTSIFFNFEILAPPGRFRPPPPPPVKFLAMPLQWNKHWSLDVCCHLSGRV